MKQHQSLMQRCIDMEFTQSDQQRWISSLTRSYSILSNPAIVLVIHCLPIVFLLSQRYLESSTQHQSNKETSNTSSLSLSPDDLRTVSRNHCMQNHHSSSTIESSNTNTSKGYDNGTWCTIHTYFFTRTAYQPILKPRSIFQKIHLPENPHPNITTSRRGKR